MHSTPHMAPIATADGTLPHNTETALGNSAVEANVALKLAAAEPEHGSNTTSTTPDGDAKQLQYPRSRVNLVDRFVDEPRKIKVIVIGGGLAGILAGCLLPQKVPGIELVIYEKNPDFVSCSETEIIFFGYLSLPEMTDRYRGVLGTRTRIPEFAATYLLMSISRHSVRRPTGRTNLPPVQRSETTGSQWQRSTMSTNTPGFNTKSKMPVGTQRPVPGL